MRHKTVKFEVKAAGDAGEFTALASVFGNVDLVGDRMLPGAFSKTLERWREAGDPIPVVLSHQWDDPMAYVGKADPNDVTETAEGLVVKGQLDTSTEVGKQVYKLMADRVLKAWSFGYTVPEGGEEYKDGVNNVSEADLIEVGPTLKGANPEAQTLAIKAMGDAMGAAHIDRMVQMANDFIAQEPEAADKEKMRGVVSTLQSMAAAEQTEKTHQPPEVEDRRDEEQVSSSKRQDPLKDEFAKSKLRLSVGELP